MAVAFASIALRLALVLPLVGLWFVSHPGQSYACSCIDPGSPSEELADSVVVFAGRAVSIDRSLVSGSSLDPIIVEFYVHTVWKGPASQVTHLTTAAFESSCGYSFEEGGEYLVYSWNGWEVSLCSRTRPLSQAAYDLGELGPGQTPTQGTTGLKPDVLDPRADGGCGPSPGADGLPLAWLVAGIAWLGLRKRSSGAR